MEPHRRGEATEAIVLAELKQRDIAVSHPFGDNERYDAVIEAPDGELLKVQIKTGWKKNGCIRFHTKTQHTNSTGHVYKPYGDRVDYFVVYSPDTEEIYLVD